LAKPVASIGVVAAAAWTLSVMAAFNVGAISGFGSDWHAFHTLLGGHLLSAAGILVLGILAVRSQHLTRSEAQRVVRWVLLFTFLTCAVAIRGTIEDYQRPAWWWSVFGLAGSGAVLAMLAGFAERRRYLYGAAFCVNLAATNLFFSPLANRFNFAGDAEAVLTLGWFNVLALALPVALWLWVERRYIEPNTLERRRLTPFGAHRFSTAAAALLMTATVVVGIVADIGGQPIATPEWLGWCALAGTFVAVLACCWDPRVRGGALSLYLVGIVGIGFAVDRFNLPLKWLIFHGAVITAAYAIATSYLWSRREGLSLLARRLKMPVDVQRPWRTLNWLVPANCLLIAGVLALVTQIVLTFEEPLLRLAAAKAAWFQVVALMLLTRGEKQNYLRFGALLLGMVGAMLWGWAWLNPGDGQQILDRGVIAMAVLAGSGVLYGFGLIKLLKAENPWLAAGQKMTPICIGGSLVALALILGGEVVYFFGSESVPMAHWSEAVVGASLVGLAIAAIVAAVVPGRDPLGLSERGRQVYVYGAEILLAATFLHVRICLPEYFEGHFRKYWPLIVMAIAFLGVGLSEWFRRRNQAVLSQPLERTGALLPLLPVLGFWMIDPDHFQTNYSVLLLVVGGLYAALAVLRRSFGFGILAALAANGGLWYFLQKQPGFGFLEHPQIWLIPPAMCVLVAAYLNRERLSPAQMTQIRYITAMTIYVSSTADIFLNGMDDAPWLPFVLGGLAIIGVMAGILFRVRAFLYLGTSFLVLSLLCMIYHAAHDLGQTWLWYACGIALGALIYVAFAIVEKKRQEFLHVLERLKEWEA
jgi:hypothetical protein